jgi:hypothetical protein
LNEVRKIKKPGSEIGMFEKMAGLNMKLDLGKMTQVFSPRRVLGVDISENGARIVHLQRRLLPRAQKTSSVEAKESFSVPWDLGASIEEKAQLLKEALQLRKIRTAYAVASLPAQAIRSASERVPLEEESIAEWVRSHAGTLLKVPIPIDQVSIGYEILDHVEGGTIIEVWFVRTMEIENAATLLERAGLHLLAVGTGVQETLSLLSDQEVLPDAGSFVLLLERGQFCWAMPHVEGKRKSGATFSRASVQDGLVELIQRSTLGGAHNPAEVPVLFAGEKQDGWVEDSWEECSVLGLPPEMTLAAGLAARGLAASDASPLNFLPTAHSKHTRAKMRRVNMRRALLAAGLVLLGLLGTPIFLTGLLEREIKAQEEALADGGPAIAQASALEKVVAELEKRASEGILTRSRTNLARTLHDIASGTPGDITLQRCTAIPRSDQQLEISIIGHTRKSEAIAAMLTGLERLSMRGRLVQSSVGSQDKITFELHVIAQEE